MGERAVWTGHTVVSAEVAQPTIRYTSPSPSTPQRVTPDAAPVSSGEGREVHAAARLHAANLAAVVADLGLRVSGPREAIAEGGHTACLARLQAVVNERDQVEGDLFAALDVIAALLRNGDDIQALQAGRALIGRVRR